MNGRALGGARDSQLWSWGGICGSGATGFTTLARFEEFDKKGWNTGTGVGGWNCSETKIGGLLYVLVVNTYCQLVGHFKQHNRKNEPFMH